MLQAAGVLRRIAQAVDMVEAQALQRVLRDQARHQRMEHGGILDADAGEVADIEEAPIVHRREGDAPIGEAVMLALEQAVQRRAPASLSWR